MNVNIGGYLMTALTKLAAAVKKLTYFTNIVILNYKLSVNQRELGSTNPNSLHQYFFKP